VIAKQVQEIQHLCRQQSHALIVDDIQGPIDVEAHAHDTNMQIDNDVIKNVVATITTRVLKEIHTPVCKQPSVALLPPSPIAQSLNIDSRLFFFSAFLHGE
jgi:hypothetical protein